MSRCRRSFDGVPRSTASLRDFAGPDKIVILCPTCQPHADWLLREQPGVVRVESSKRRVTLHLAHPGDAQHVGDSEKISALLSARPPPPTPPAPTATNAAAQQAEYEVYRWRIRHETHGEFVERRRREREAKGLKRVYRNRSILAEETAAAYARRLRALPDRAFASLSPRFSVPRLSEPHVCACMRQLAALCAERGVSVEFVESGAPPLPRRFAPTRGDQVRSGAEARSPADGRKRARLLLPEGSDDEDVIEYIDDSD